MEYEYPLLVQRVFEEAGKSGDGRWPVRHPKGTPPQTASASAS